MAQPALASDEDEYLICVDDRAEFDAQDGHFQALILISKWKEPKKMTERLTVYVNLPSGVAIREFSVPVLEDDEIVELSTVRTKPLLDVDVLQRKWTILPKEAFRV